MSKEYAVVGVYENPCYEQLKIRSDSTFRFSYPVANHFEVWSIGNWKLEQDRLILKGSVVYDSIESQLTIIPNNDTNGTPQYTPEPLEELQTVVSHDSISDHIDAYEARLLQVAFSRIRQSTNFVDTLLITTQGLKRISSSFNSECNKLIRRKPNKN